jgi:DNA-binding response OmpR family regulator
MNAMNSTEQDKKRILIVDDDPEISESTRLALEALGYEVEVARDGSTGLALAERRRPDLMILDMMMPKRSGFLVLETLRQIDDFPTRIIIHQTDTFVKG